MDEQTYENIKYAMYQGSKICGVIGTKKEIIKIFPWMLQEKLVYIGVLKRSPLVSEGKSSYSYLILIDGKVVDQYSEEYETTIENLPKVENVAAAIEGGKSIC